MHTKKYRASPLTAKKKSNNVRRWKKLSGKLKIYPPPIKNQMVRPLAKRICGESRDSGYVFMSRNHETSPNPHP